MREYRKKHKTKTKKATHKYYMKTKTQSSIRHHVNYGNRISKKANATRRAEKQDLQNYGYLNKTNNAQLQKRRINKRGLTNEEEKILKILKNR